MICILEHFHYKIFLFETLRRFIKKDIKPYDTNVTVNDGICFHLNLIIQHSQT